MLGQILFATSLIIALAIGGIYFRDLGDVPQLFMKVKRSSMIRFIRYEYRFLAVLRGTC